MDLWQASSFVVTPTRSRDGFVADIKDQSGSLIGTSDAAGRVMDAVGGVLLQAPVRYEAPRTGPISVEMPIADAQGRALGTARVVKWGLGPRSKKATVALLDPEGEEVARVEPEDKKGEKLVATAGGVSLASVDVTDVKTGFMQKAKVITATLPAEIPKLIRPLVLCAIVRYYAIIEGLEAASLHKDAKG